MKTKIILKFFQLMMITCFCLIPTFVEATTTSVTLLWDANLETNIAGYTLVYGTTSKVYDKTVVLGKVTKKKISGLSRTKRYYFAIKARDTDGVESDLSAEVNFKYKKESLLDKIKGWFSAPPAPNLTAKAAMIQDEVEPVDKESMKLPVEKVVSSPKADLPPPKKTKSSDRKLPMIQNSESIVMTWGEVEGATKYKIRCGSDSNNYEVNKEIVRQRLLRVPRPQGNDKYFCRVEALNDKNERLSLSKEVVLDNNIKALQTKLPWLKFSFGEVKRNGVTGDLEVEMFKDASIKKDILSPGVGCIYKDGVIQKIEPVDFLAKEASRVLLFPGGLTAPNLFLEEESLVGDERNTELEAR